VPINVVLRRRQAYSDGKRKIQVPDPSVRGFLVMFKRDFPGDFLRIAEPVKREFDITAAVFELKRAGRNPICFS